MSERMFGLHMGVPEKDINFRIQNVYKKEKKDRFSAFQIWRLAYTTSV